MDVVLIPADWLAWLKDNPEGVETFLGYCRSALKQQRDSFRVSLKWMSAELAETRVGTEAPRKVDFEALKPINVQPNTDEELPLGDEGVPIKDVPSPETFTIVLNQMLEKNFPKAATATASQGKLLWERCGQPDDNFGAVRVLAAVLSKIVARRSDPSYTMHVRSLLRTTETTAWDELVNEAEAYLKVAGATPQMAEAQRQSANEALAAKPPTAPAPPEGAMDRMMAQRNKLTGTRGS